MAISKSDRAEFEKLRPFLTVAAAFVIYLREPAAGIEAAFKGAKSFFERAAIDLRADQ